MWYSMEFEKKVFFFLSWGYYNHIYEKTGGNYKFPNIGVLRPIQNEIVFLQKNELSSFFSKKKYNYGDLPCVSRKIVDRVVVVSFWRIGYEGICD